MNKYDSSVLLASPDTPRILLFHPHPFVLIITKPACFRVDIPSAQGTSQGGNDVRYGGLWCMNATCIAGNALVLTSPLSHYPLSHTHNPQSLYVFTQCKRGLPMRKSNWNPYFWLCKYECNQYSCHNLDSSRFLPSPGRRRKKCPRHLTAGAGMIRRKRMSQMPDWPLWSSRIRVSFLTDVQCSFLRYFLLSFLRLLGTRKLDVCRVLSISSGSVFLSGSFFPSLFRLERSLSFLMTKTAL